LQVMSTAQDVSQGVDQQQQQQQPGVCAAHQVVDPSRSATVDPTSTGGFLHVVSLHVQPLPRLVQAYHTPAARTWHIARQSHHHHMCSIWLPSHRVAECTSATAVVEPLRI
jgi:hypothetical protein